MPSEWGALGQALKAVGSAAWAWSLLALLAWQPTDLVCDQTAKFPNWEFESTLPKFLYSKVAFQIREKLPTSL